MEIWLDEEWLKALYRILVDIYRNTDYPITVGYNDGIINVCIERPLTGIYDFIPFPHFLHKASVLMETIINFHPFADGNKRVALLATFYFLHWNGYDLAIPKNADEFTIEVAEGKRNVNDILAWLTRYSKRGFLSITRNLFFQICASLWEESSVFEEFIGLLAPLFFPLYPFLFFRDKIMEMRKKK
jgi:death-on-curing protein